MFKKIEIKIVLFFSVFFILSKIVTGYYTSVLTLIITVAFRLIAFYLLIVRNLSLPLEQINLNAKKVSKGDLRVSFASDKEDNIGQLSGVLNTMVNYFRESFLSIAGFTESLMFASKELKTVFEQMSENMKITFAKADSVASISNEMAVDIDAVATAMVQSTASISAVVTSMEEINSSVSASIF